MKTTDLTLNEHKLLTRLDQGMLPYNEVMGLALDRLIELGFARVMEVLSARAADGEVKFAWGGVGEGPVRTAKDFSEIVPVRAVNITDKGRKELQSEP